MPPDDVRRRADWYFDVISPFAYLQLKAHLPRLRTLADICPVPIVLGGVLAHWGQRGPAEIAPKRLHTYRLAQFRARELGVPMRFPPAHPFSPLVALRAIVALGSGWEVVDAVFDALWRDGVDLGDAQAFAGLVERLECPDLAERIRADAVKRDLRGNGERALAAGVFGVPTLVLDDHLFWGEDATTMLLGFLHDPKLFRAPDMARLEALPVGVVRG